MLIEFRVTNYRSFKDRATLSLRAAAFKTRTASELDGNTFVAVMPGRAKPITLLKSAAIYGPNAGGKSNLVRALQFMRHFVRTSVTPSVPETATETAPRIDVEPFRLNTQTRDEPSVFEILFVQEGIPFRYGFSVTPLRVVEEWLYFSPHGVEVRAFERDGQDITVESHFKEGRGVAKHVREDSLFLTVAAQFNVPLAVGVVSWFRERCRTVSGLEDHGLKPFTLDCLKAGNEHCEAILNLVRGMDVGIRDVAVQAVSSDALAFPDEVPDALRRKIREEAQKGRMLHLETTHDVYDADGHRAGEERFDADENESQGTQKLIALAGPLADTLANGWTLIVDELEARLHPAMTREIVRLFHDPATNPHNAQLVFVTHDTNLMDGRLLRRDQMYLVDKNERGESTLFAVSDFAGVRPDMPFEKAYLEGQFRAVPFPGGMRRALTRAVLSPGAAREGIAA